ncbi:MAG TPA: regulator [Dehalococcoidia bacterium]|nr:regulator [Dehalococcoidia bacterium]
MVEVSPQVHDLDQRAMKVFLKAIDVLGGPRALVEHRRLTWLPSLMEAAYAVVLREEGHKTADDIASFLGLSSASVRNLLAAQPEAVEERLKGEVTEEQRVHVAGGLAKLAYSALRREEAA